MADAPRRFPAPWRSDKIPGGYVVRDANGQAIAYLYSRENEAEARQAKMLTADEARRIARRLPELLGNGEQQGQPVKGSCRSGADWQRRYGRSGRQNRTKSRPVNAVYSKETVR
jgi:hypothetical protein